jgi:hypothetical protein
LEQKNNNQSYSKSNFLCEIKLESNGLINIIILLEVGDKGVSQEKCVDYHDEKKQNEDNMGYQAQVVNTLQAKGHFVLEIHHEQAEDHKVEEAHCILAN